MLLYIAYSTPEYFILSFKIKKTNKQTFPLYYISIDKEEGASRECVSNGRLSGQLNTREYGCLASTCQASCWEPFGGASPNVCVSKMNINLPDFNYLWRTYIKLFKLFKQKVLNVFPKIISLLQEISYNIWTIVLWYKFYLTKCITLAVLLI